MPTIGSHGASILRDFLSHVDQHSIATGATSAQVVAVAMVVGVLASICAILNHRGPRVQVSTCIFVMSLVLTQLLMKALSSPPYSFRFPATVTAAHFISAWVSCWAICVLRGHPGRCLPSSMGSAHRYFAYIFPIAASLPFSIIFSNSALLYIGAGLNSVLGTLTPVTTAMLSHALGRKLAHASWVGVMVACVGAGVIDGGEVRRAMRETSASETMMIGIAFSSAAILLRSLKVVLQDRLLAPSAYAGGFANAQPLEAMHVWALQAPPCAVICCVYAFVAESPSEFCRQLSPAIAKMIFGTCASATALNLLGMYIIQNLGASTMQIIGKLNTIITMAISVSFLGETMSAVTFAGTALVLIGVAMFETAEARAKTMLLLPKGV